MSLISVTLSSSDFVRIGIFNDLHLLADTLHDNGYRASEYVSRTGKNIIASGEVLDISIERLLQSNIDVLLIPGDLTNEGEKESHFQLSEKLNTLREAGIQTFVIPGNHDINNSRSKGYRGNITYEVETIDAVDFRNIYINCGYDWASTSDVHSLSYFAPINDSLWLLALDVAQYNDKADNQSIGKLQDGTRQWLIENLEIAKQNDKQVIAMMHWSLLEHMPFKKDFFGNYLVSNADNLRDILMDMGVRLVFTGHFHAHDIQKYTNGSDATIYDVATGSLCSHPYSMRIVEMNGNFLNIKSERIVSTPSFPNLASDSREDIVRLARNRSIPLFKNNPIDFTADDINILSNIAGRYFADTFAGNEELSKEDILQIQQIFTRLEFPVAEALDNISLEEQTDDCELSISLK